MGKPGMEGNELRSTLGTALRKVRKKLRKQFKNPGKKIWATGRVYSTRNTRKPESCLSLKAVLFPEEAKVNHGNAGLSRRVAIWLQWGVLEVVEKGGEAQSRHSGVQS